MTISEEAHERAIDIAAREGYVVRCKTDAPRFLEKYASDDIMKMQHENARVIIETYLKALAEDQLINEEA